MASFLRFLHVTFVLLLVITAVAFDAMAEEVMDGIQRDPYFATKSGFTTQQIESLKGWYLILGTWSVVLRISLVIAVYMKFDERNIKTWESMFCSLTTVSLIKRDLIELLCNVINLGVVHLAMLSVATFIVYKVIR